MEQGGGWLGQTIFFRHFLFVRCSFKAGLKEGVCAF